MYKKTITKLKITAAFMSTEWSVVQLQRWVKMDLYQINREKLQLNSNHSNCIYSLRIFSGIIISLSYENKHASI